MKKIQITIPIDTLNEAPKARAFDLIYNGTLNERARVQGHNFKRRVLYPMLINTLKPKKSVYYTLCF